MSASLAMTRRPSVSFREGVLAWAVSPDDKARYERVRNRVLVLLVLLCLIALFTPKPTEDRSQAPVVPPRVVKMMLEREAAPPPPKPELAAKKDITPEKPVDKAEAKPDPKPERANREPLPRANVPEARNPIAGRPPGEVEGARRRAAGVGLLAMKDELSELRGAPAAPQLRQDIKPGAGVGTGVGVGVGAGQEAGLPSRSMITSNATGGSGGINTAAYSRDTGGGGLAGRATTLVEGVAGGGGGGGPGGGGAIDGRGTGAGKGGGSGAGGAVQRGAGGKASRSVEDLRLVFERNKGAISAIYNRALREDPTLQGKVVFELKISPSGEVVACRIVATELNNAELERKLVARIRQFDFGAKDVNEMVTTYPFDFLPS